MIVYRFNQAGRQVPFFENLSANLGMGETEFLLLHLALRQFLKFTPDDYFLGLFSIFLGNNQKTDVVQHPSCIKSFQIIPAQILGYHTRCQTAGDIVLPERFYIERTRHEAFKLLHHDHGQGNFDQRFDSDDT